jgi:hypothetical protein
MSVPSLRGGSLFYFHSKFYCSYTGEYHNPSYIITANYSARYEIFTAVLKKTQVVRRFTSADCYTVTYGLEEPTVSISRSSGPSFLHGLTLNTKAASSSEALIIVYQSTRHNFVEDLNGQQFSLWVVISWNCYGWNIKLISWSWKLHANKDLIQKTWRGDIIVRRRHR